MKKWSKLAKGLQNVVFTGWVNKHELKYLSDIADISLMAYSKGAPQGLPIKYLNTCLRGYLFYHHYKGKQKIFKNKKIGLSYEPGSVESFIKNLKSLLKDETLRRELGESGKTLLENEFTSEIVYNKLTTYLENVKKNYKSTKRINTI